MKTLFLGHQTIGQRCLQALLNVGAQIKLVVGHEGQDSLEPIAFSHNIPFQKTDRAPQSWQWEGDGPDWIVSVYFRHLIPESMLGAPKGAMNIHCSLLPAYRGCAPVNWAILNGEKRVGVTLHDMVAQADAGSIIEQVPFDIESNQNAGEVMEQLSDIAANILIKQYPLVLNDQVQRTHQTPGNYPIYRRRTPKDGVVDWSWSAERIHNLIRAVSPVHLYGGATTPDGHVILASKLVIEHTPPPNGFQRICCGKQEQIDVCFASKIETNHF